MKQKKLLRKLALFWASFLLIVTIFLEGLFLWNQGKIALGLRVAGLHLGGMTASQASRALAEAWQDYIHQKIVFSYQDQERVLEVRQIPVKFNLEATLQKAWQIGREKSFWLNLSQKLQALIGLTRLPWNVTLLKKDLEGFIQKYLASWDNPPIEAKVILQKERFQASPSQPGEIIARSDLTKKILDNIFWRKTQEITISKVSAFPKITTFQAQQAARKANQILDQAPFALVHSGQSFPIPAPQISQWLEFIPQEEKLQVTLNQKALEDFLIQLAPSLAQQPFNARLRFQKNQVIVVQPSQIGQSLDVETTLKALKKNILSGIQETAAFVSQIPAPVREDNLGQLKLETLLGVGESNFGGSPSSRVHNIKVGAEKFNGLLVSPGEEFSFNEILGQVGPQEGYLPELVIKEDKTIPEYGGGLCQISTTLFRAALKAGMKITERYPHSYPVRYYSPQGFDATVYPPQPDLRFINNTPGHILIQSEVSGNFLRFFIFGPKQEKIVKIKGPKVLKLRPEDQESGFILKTVITQEIYDSKGSLLSRQNFYSKYKSPKLYPIQRNPLE